MYVRLAAAWSDPRGTVHGAGEFVDIDAVTLAELEEQGVVENAGEEFDKPGWMGPGKTEEQQDTGWMGPGESADDTDAPDADEELAEEE